MKRIFLLIFLGICLSFCSAQKADPVTKKEKDDSINKKIEAEMEDLMNLQDGDTLVAKIETNMGTIEIELYADLVPKTVKNFVGLSLKGVYDGVIFHRVIDQFMIQGGDPTGTGRGGESFYGGKFEDEFVDSLRHDTSGILSMANAGPNTNSSQFFITLIPTPWLDGKHSIFGKVIAGMNVVESIGKVPTTKPFDKPLNDVVMEKVTIEKRNAE